MKSIMEIKLKNEISSSGILVLILVLTISVSSTSCSFFSLDGKHLVIGGMQSSQNYRLVKNATGDVIAITGVCQSILQWLSIFYNFSYSPIKTNPKHFEDNGTVPGIGSFLIKGESDVVAMVVPTKQRISLMDFSHPPFFAPTTYLIPKPAPSVSLSAVVKPFQYLVWIAIGLAFFAVILIWYLFLKMKNPLSSMSKDQSIIILYILRTLLKEPGEIFRIKQMPILMVIGSWSMAAFILTIYYNTLLISFISAPNPKPLINSIYDLQNRSDLFLLTDEIGNANAILSAADSGFLKEMRDKLNSYPKSRCTSIKQCVELVKSGSHIYFSGRDAFIYTAMRDDLVETGKCNMEMGHEFFTLFSAFTTRKYSPFMPSINYGLMRMRETGLIKKWVGDFRADARQCVQKRRNSEIHPDDMSPLPLSAFAGAFCVLLIGILFSLIVIAGEYVLKPKVI